MSRSDRIKAFLVGFLPAAVAAWLWNSPLSLCGWEPHILGRAMGRDIKWGRVDKA